MPFTFEILKTNHNARVGIMKTTHGDVPTPTFMTVGTVGTVKALSSEDLLACEAPIILGNTYHLHLRPGEKAMEELGGLHKFMNWSRPILTDSGGFQVFSLGAGQKPIIDSSHIPLTEKSLNNQKSSYQMAKIDEDGVTFKSHLDGSMHRLTPESAVQIQQAIGSDIMMAFDECTPNSDKQYVIEAMERTHRWLVRSKQEWLKGEERKVGYSLRHSQPVADPVSGTESRIGNPSITLNDTNNPIVIPSGSPMSTVGRLEDDVQKNINQALFGIIQGGDYQDLRLESAKFVSEQDLPGIAIGGVSVGYYMDKTVEHVGWVKQVIDHNKPFYTMGVGRDPQDIVDMVLAGVDMFDCVAPTRLARNGTLYHGYLEGSSLDPGSDSRIRFVSEFNQKGRLQIGNAQFKLDQRPILDGCDCATCRAGYTRAYLHHLWKAQELLYYRLASIHNVRFMIRLSQELRKRILEQ